MSKRYSAWSETHTLSSEQLQFYRDNGYLVMKGLIEYSTLMNCRRRFSEYVNGVVESSILTVIKEPALVKIGAKGEDAINKLQEIHYDEVFMSYTEHPKLTDVLSQLVGDRLSAIHSMLINKPPGANRHPPHQDLMYFPHRPADRIIGAWTAIDPVSIANGSLYVMPRSHKQDTLYPHNKDSARAMYHGIPDEMVCEKDRLHLEMNPGDTVVFHPLLVHGSGPNCTKAYRKAISCHYANQDCDYIRDVKGTVQEGIFKDVEEMAHRRGLHNFTCIDIWELKKKPIDVSHLRRNSKL